jgi:hypothetical protein
MSNAVTTPNAGGLAALQSLRTGLQQVRATIPASVGGTPLLRLLKDGQWVAGAEDTALPAGTEVMINPMSFQSGYSCWTNRAPGQGKNELMGEEMWGIGAPKPPASTLPIHHDPRTQDLCAWKDAMGVDIKVLDGSMMGQQVLYKATSVGGIRALTTLLDAIMARLDSGTEYVCPVVSLGSDSYQHQSYGRTYVPVLDIVGWANMQGIEEAVVGGAPPPVDKVVKQPEPEPQPVAAEPVGRRRRI